MATKKLTPSEFMEQARPILLSIGKASIQTTPANDTMEAVNEAKASLAMIEAAAAQLREVIDGSIVEPYRGGTLL